MRRYLITLQNRGLFNEVMPLGWSQPSLLVGDSFDSGVWFWSASATDSRIFHWDGISKILSSWSIGSSPDARGASSSSGLGVSSDHTVWLGLSDTLFHLDPVSGTITTLAVPAQPGNLAAEQYEPPEIRGVHGINALAINPINGDISVALSATSAVATWSPKANAWSTRATPQDTSADAIAYTSSGTEVVALSNYRTHLTDQIMSMSNTDIVALTDVGGSGVAVADGPDVIVGSFALVRLSESSRAKPRMIIRSLRTDFDFSNALGIDPLPGHALVSYTASTITVLNAHLRVQRSLKLPNYPCFISIPPHPGGENEAVMSCPSSFYDVATDAAGDIWFTAGGHAQDLGELKARR